MTGKIANLFLQGNWSAGVRNRPLGIYEEGKTSKKVKTVDSQVLEMTETQHRQENFLSPMPVFLQEYKLRTSVGALRILINDFPLGGN